MAVDLPFTFDADPFDIPGISLGPFPSTASAIEAHLVSPSAIEFVLSRAPPRVHADRPLELELAAVRLGVDAGDACPMASWIFAHARLCISVEVPGQPQRQVSVPISARRYGSGWIVRALARPSAWVNTASLTLVSMSLAGRPLSCDGLPVTLQVGYTHAPAPAGAIHAAALDGDVPALQAALDAGGSTEEADADGWTASYCAAFSGHLEALRTLLAAGANPTAASNVRGSLGMALWRMAEDGWTPLHTAAFWGHASIVALLLATPGVDPLAKNREGSTPLDSAQAGYGLFAAAALLQADPRVTAAGNACAPAAPGGALAARPVARETPQ